MPKLDPTKWEPWKAMAAAFAAGVAIMGVALALVGAILAALLRH